MDSALLAAMQAAQQSGNHGGARLLGMLPDQQQHLLDAIFPIEQLNLEQFFARILPNLNFGGYQGGVLWRMVMEWLKQEPFYEQLQTHGVSYGGDHHGPVSSGLDHSSGGSAISYDHHL